MSFYWLLFANLCVLGMLVYNTCFKLSGASINAFTFTLILGSTQALALMAGLVAAKYGFKMDLIGDLKPRGVAFAALAGLSVIVVDMSFFLAFRYGSAMLTNAYCNVASVIMFTVLSVVFFGETLTWMKGIGVILGVASLILITL